MLIGYARVSKADGSQSLDLQHDALRNAGVNMSRIYSDRAPGKKDERGVKIFYGVNARIWENPVSCCHITFFVGCSLLPPNRKSTGIRTIRTTPTLRGAIPSSRTETHTPNPLLPLDLHYSIRNVHP